ncbi:MAG: TetR/AcrR family transcriptional regulator [Candidatus Thorarchaeota archaeon]
MVSLTKRTYNKKQKMKAIRNATVNLLPKRGYMDLTTKEVAEKAGVAIGLLYKYFPAGKVEIVKSIAEEIAEEMTDKVMSVEKYFNVESGSDMKDFVREGVLRAVSYHRADKDMIIAIEMAYLSDPKTFGYYALDNYENYDNQASKLLIKYVAERMGKKVDESYAKFLMDIIDAVIHRHVILIPSAPTDEEFSNALTDMILELISSQEDL